MRDAQLASSIRIPSSIIPLKEVVHAHSNPLLIAIAVPSSFPHTSASGAPWSHWKSSWVIVKYLPLLADRFQMSAANGRRTESYISNAMDMFFRVVSE